MSKKSKKSKNNSTLSAEEAALEDLIFGASTSSSSSKPVVSLDIDYSKASSRSEDVEVEDGDDDIDILLDRSGGGSHKLGKESASGKKRHKKRDTQKAAWHDEDDDNVMVDLNSKDRLKKLRKLDKNGKLLKNTMVTGTEFRELLKKKFFPNSMAAGAEEGDNDSDEEPPPAPAMLTLSTAKLSSGADHAPLGDDDGNRQGQSFFFVPAPEYS